MSEVEYIQDRMREITSRLAEQFIDRMVGEDIFFAECDEMRRRPPLVSPQSVGDRLRSALGVGSVPIRYAIELAIERLNAAQRGEHE